MKKLIVINGTIGVGKSTVSSALKNKLADSVLLDGDWCWMMHPWKFTAANKRMVERNITFMLNSFLGNPSFRYVIFTWVLPRESILRDLLHNISYDYELHFLTLTCSREELIKRLNKDNRDEKGINKSLDLMKNFDHQSSVKIDTNGKGINKVVENIVTKLSGNK